MALPLVHYLTLISFLRNPGFSFYFCSGTGHCRKRGGTRGGQFKQITIVRTITMVMVWLKFLENGNGSVMVL